jgi:3-oxoacyl-[acyl-carrier protein] reductase
LNDISKRLICSAIYTNLAIFEAMNLDLSGKTALVCGSTQGIGKATALALAKMGANIILLARNEEKLKAVLKELDLSNNQNHSYMCADFSNQNAISSVAKKIKNKQVHILINNTGGPAGGSISQANPEAFIAAFQMHLIANQKLSQAVIPNMKDSCFGRIINVLSTSVKVPINGLGVSNTIRGAVASWAKTLANELGSHGITVNNVLPGFTHTNRLTTLIENKAQTQNVSEEQIANAMLSSVPAKRFGKAEEVANAIAFLCSPAASYINGVNVPVDGGRTGTL